MFDEIYASLTREEILLEYLTFLRNLPDFISSEKHKIVKTVEKAFKIDEIIKDGTKFEFNSLIAKKKDKFDRFFIHQTRVQLKHSLSSSKRMYFMREEFIDQ